MGPAACCGGASSWGPISTVWFFHSRIWRHENSKDSTDVGPEPTTLNWDPHIPPLYRTVQYWVSYRVGVLFDANLEPEHKSKVFVHGASEGEHRLDAAGETRLRLGEPAAQLVEDSHCYSP